jgi:hypothetical protein
VEVPACSIFSYDTLVNLKNWAILFSINYYKLHFYICLLLCILKTLSSSNNHSINLFRAMFTYQLVCAYPAWAAMSPLSKL